MRLENTTSPNRLNPWLGRTLLAIAAAVCMGPVHAAVVTDPTVVTGANAIDPPGSESVDVNAPGATAQSTLEGISGFGAVQSFGAFEYGTNTIVFTDAAKPDMQISSSGAAAYTDRSTSGSNSIKIFQNSNSGYTRSIDFGSYNTATSSFDGTVNPVRAAGFTIAGLRNGDYVAVRFRSADNSLLSEQIVDVDGSSLTETEPTSGEGAGREVYFGYDSGSTGISRIDISAVAGAVQAARGWDDIGWAPLAAAPANARYVTPSGGAVTKDGLSWETAYAQDKIDEAWAEVGTAAGANGGGVVYIGSGTYSSSIHTYSLGGGGTASAPRKIVGVKYPAGGDYPVFVGNWNGTTTVSPYNGRNFLSFSSTANNCWIENLVLQKYQFGITWSGTTARSGFTLKNVDMTEFCMGVEFPSGASISTFTAEDCDFKFFPKSAIRFRGVSGVNILNCTADAGGITYANTNSPFQMGFQVVSGNNILFEDCVANNAYHNNGTEYWNGDGFTVEGAADTVTFRRCRAFNNTDAGWDLKSTNTRLEHCVGMRNKRNFRLWYSGTLYNCFAGYTVHPGGGGNAAGLWTQTASTDPGVLVQFSSFHNNGSGLREEGNGTVTVEDCIVSTTNTAHNLLLGNAGFVVVRTAQYKAGVSGTDPQYVNATNSAWNGIGTDFDSQLYGLTKGYSSQR